MKPREKRGGTGEEKERLIARCGRVRHSGGGACRGKSYSISIGKSMDCINGEALHEHSVWKPSRV